MGPLSGAQVPSIAFCPVHLQRERERTVTVGSRDVRVGEPLKLSLKKGGVPADLRR